MVTKNFEDIKDLCAYINDVNDETLKDIDVIAHYDIITDVISELIKTYGCYIKDVTLDDGESSGYTDEYILSIENDGSIWCQPIKNEDKYLNVSQNDIIFINSDCNSKIIQANKNVPMIEFNFGEDLPSNSKDNVLTRDGNTVHRAWSDGTSYYSSSFISSDDDLVNAVFDIWKNLR